MESIAFTWIVYQITGSAAWSAIIFTFIMLPNVIVQPFAGAIVEKMNKKAVVTTTHFLRALMIALFIFLFKYKLVNSLLLSIFALTITTIESFYLPAASALTAKVLKKEDIKAGTSLNSVFSNAATLAGSGIAGFIIAKPGVSAAMFTDLATFIIAAALISTINVNTKPTPSPSENKAPQNTGYLSMLREGFTYVFKATAIRNFCIICVLLNGLMIPLYALQAPIVTEIYGMGSELMSISGIFASIGGIFGAAILPGIAAKLPPIKITILGTGLLACSMACIPCGTFIKENTPLASTLLCACNFTIMTAVSLVGGILNIQFMKCVDRNYISRASAVFNSSATAVTPIGSSVISLLVLHISAAQVLTINAILAAITLLLILLTRPALDNT